MTWEEELLVTAQRVCEEAIRLVLRPVHDGTRCVLVPERLMEHLEVAVARAKQEMQA